MEAGFEQLDHGILTYPAGGWRRFMFRFPLVLWRLGLGFIVGRVILVLTVTGRESGLPRSTMAEYYRLNDIPYVCCAFGERAQWYKNIVADPRVMVQTARGSESMIASRVTDDQELAAVYRLFKTRNPVMTGWYLETIGIDNNVDDFVASKDRAYFIRFDPTDEPTPPPMEADLRWVLPAIVVWLVGLWLYRSHRQA